MPTNAMVGMEATPGTLIATKGSPGGWETAVRGQQRRGGSRGEGAAEARGQRRRGSNVHRSTVYNSQDMEAT